MESSNESWNWPGSPAALAASAEPPGHGAAPAWTGAQRRHLEPLALKRLLHILWAHWECQTTAWGVQSLPQPRYSLSNWLRDEYYFSIKVLHLPPDRIPGLLCAQSYHRAEFLRWNLQLSPQCHLLCDITKLTLEILTLENHCDGCLPFSDTTILQLQYKPNHRDSHLDAK